MKHALSIFFVVGTLGAGAHAHVGDVSPTLTELNVVRVGQRGEVLKRDGVRTRVRYVVGIPATIDPGSACTQFVGQETVNDVIKVKGASDPVNDACIAVMPAPVETVLTVDFHIHQVVPRPSVHMKHVRIGRNTYLVSLDTANDSVTVANISVRPGPRPLPFPLPGTIVPLHENL
jgi:hypothetical protein